MESLKTLTQERSTPHKYDNTRSKASRVYGVSLSSVKRWCKQYQSSKKECLWLSKF